MIVDGHIVEAPFYLTPCFIHLIQLSSAAVQVRAYLYYILVDALVLIVTDNHDESKST